MKAQSEYCQRQYLQVEVRACNSLFDCDKLRSLREKCEIIWTRENVSSSLISTQGEKRSSLF